MIRFLRELLYKGGLLQIVELPSFVLSVGNISLGGTGKSPFVMQLAAFALERQASVVVLTRGYKRKYKKLKIVLPFSPLPSVDEIGDEPRMIKARVPGISLLVHKDRAKMAHRHWKELNSPQIVILDDAFQHFRARRDFDVVMVDATERMEQAVLPFGRLRERVEALRRADLVIITRAKMVSPEHLLQIREKIKKVVQRKIQSPWKRRTKISQATEVVAMDYEITSFTNQAGESLPTLPKRDFVVLAGIAKPESFRATVQSLNLKVHEEIYYSDHYQLSKKDLQKLKKRFPRETALLMSEKDWSRWNEILSGLPFDVFVIRANLVALPEDAHLYQRVLEDLLRCSI